LGGDDRYYNNIFIGGGDASQNTSQAKFGTEKYNNAKYPVFMSGNIYYLGAVPSTNEGKMINSSSFNPKIKLVETEAGVYLNITLDENYYNFKGSLITSELLTKTRVTRTLFENTDGTPLTFDKDYFGHARSVVNSAAGPFVDLDKGVITLKVW
jgi:hypothetical protein